MKPQYTEKYVLRIKTENEKGALIKSAHPVGAPLGLATRQGTHEGVRRKPPLLDRHYMRSSLRLTTSQITQPDGDAR